MKINFKKLNILYFETDEYMSDITKSILNDVVDNYPICFQDKTLALDYFKTKNNIDLILCIVNDVLKCKEESFVYKIREINNKIPIVALGEYQSLKEEVGTDNFNLMYELLQMNISRFFLSR